MKTKQSEHNCDITPTSRKVRPRGITEERDEGGIEGVLEVDEIWQMDDERRQW